MTTPPATAAPTIDAVAGVTAAVKFLAFEAGLYALTALAVPGQAGGEPGVAGGLALPSTLVAALPVAGGENVALLAAGTGPAGWIGPGGGTVAFLVPPSGGRLLVTTYRLETQSATPVHIQISRIDRPHGPPPAATPAPLPTREVAAEIVAHVAGSGPVSVAGGAWAGRPGASQRIEAFSVRPGNGLGATDVEYKAFGPSGRETPWVGDAALCGASSRGIPLTGFAIRLGPAVRDRYEVIYQGAFLEGGVGAARRNGEPCRSSLDDDPLVAISVRFVERLDNEATALPAPPAPAPLVAAGRRRARTRS